MDPPLGRVVYGIGLVVFYLISLPALLLAGEIALASTAAFYALFVPQCYLAAVGIVAVAKGI